MLRCRVSGTILLFLRQKRSIMTPTTHQIYNQLKELHFENESMESTEIWRLWTSTCFPHFWWPRACPNIIGIRFIGSPISPWRIKYKETERDKKENLRNLLTSWTQNHKLTAQQKIYLTSGSQGNNAGCLRRRKTLL